MGSDGGIPCFALLVCTAFALPNKLPLSQPPSFLTFTLPSLSFPTRVGSEQAAVWCLLADWY